MAIFSKALAFVAKSVVGGALGEPGSQVAGFVLSSIFGGGQDQEIREIGRRLSSIESSIDELKRQLDEAFKAIQEQLREIRQEQLYQAWSAQDVRLRGYVNQIDVQYGRLIAFAQNPPENKQDIEDLVRDITNTNDGAAVSLRNIQDLVMGTSQNKGLLQLWAEQVTPLIAQGRMSYSTAMRCYLNYYTGIVYAALQAINLLVEAFNQRKTQPIGKAAFMEYKQRMAALEPPFLVWIERLAIAAMQKGGAWREDPSKPGEYQRTYDYVLLYQFLFASAWWATEYQPSAVRQSAEEILAIAQALAPEQRRIVVWSLHPGNGNRESIPDNLDFNNASIQIVPTEKPGPIDPDTAMTLLNEAVTLEAPSRDALDGLPNLRLVRRYVFGDAVRDGTYRLIKNRSFPPYENASSHVTHYFMAQTYLDYILEVSAESQFDFMDFTTYPDTLSYFRIPAYNS